MQIKIDKQRRLCPINHRIAVQGEHLSTVHTFLLPRRFGALDLAQYRVQIEFQTPAGEPSYTILTDNMTTEENALSINWMPDKSFTAAAGQIIIQLVFIDVSPYGTERVVWRSEAARYRIDPSVMAAQQIEVKYPTLLADMEALRDTSYEIVESTKDKLEDHENRITTLERIGIINGGDASG